ncbi:MAG: hypothetical protein UR31_C0015G0023 [Parcubacteria group bacterium GW2011_GWA2_33_14]|uniref:Uncharacterized protein n=1 Tax=Candidatus Staskawiczbacteria bacterium RIFCSPHIGHO2_02_FULL_33_16 TaxID=1802204 RepID=A0A1G2HY59_9BACT|nr:MAG: hypothetical protein UR31_C0015G0023 [Parcubacteria group bacterium GW2011_GWA2_33_14]OGZ67130.1 MAG: hypothetical protein A3D34_02565 [Candidatus Staskawiczbacteria bacterium RIFCSPHIGHO2_02_FULL_33_16]OGZ70940.1 MAG: hypothetical protein A2980_02925 [Candidatus Staskawiczbacteria bacterium RIFCSPLOWO2_01_FULL_33_13]
MNKAIIIIIVIVVSVGAIFALKSFYTPPAKPAPTSTTSQNLPLQQLSTSSNILDRIEVAILAKLKK